MTISNMAFVPAIGLRDTTTYKTKPTNEAELRDAVQDQSDQVRDYINNTLLARLHSEADGLSGADEIGATPIAGIGDVNTDTVQKILETLKTYVDSGFITVTNGYTKNQVDVLLQGIILGQLTPGSVIDSMLSDNPGQIKSTVNAHLADYIRQPGYGVTTGGTLAYLLTLSPVPTLYADGMGLSVKINATNTGTTTINVNSLGVKTIKNPDGTDLIAGDLVAGGIYSLKYNSTTLNFILVGKGGGPNKAGSNTIFTVSTADQAITKGYYPGNLTDGKVKGEAALLAANILTGSTIGAVTGTAKRSASGTGTTDGSGNVVVTGLTFTPSMIIVDVFLSTTVCTRRSYYVDAGTYNANLNTLAVRAVGNTLNTGLSAFTITGSGFTVPMGEGSGISHAWRAVE